MVVRRISFLSLALLALCSPARARGPQEQWNACKARFISADGRNIDRQRGKISTSEGQGYAMLLGRGVCKTGLQWA